MTESLIDTELVEKAPLAKCTTCTLRNSPCVPTFGPAKVDLLIVGEAPGAEEVKSKEPFKPRQSPPNAGFLLWECFRQLGVKREQVGITNSVLCRPDGNRNPEPNEVEACNARLIHEIREREPKVVLALGNFAARALLKTKQGVTTLREQDHEFHGIPLVVTFHPAALFRMGSLFQSFAADLERAVKLVKHGKQTPPEVKFVVPKDLDQLRRALAMAARDPQHINSVDIETSHFLPSLGFIGCKGLGWKISEGEYRALVVPQHLLEDPAARLVLDQHLQSIGQAYHNCAFDVAFMRAKRWTAVPAHDTMLMSYAIDERRGIHGLEILAKTHCGAPNWKQQFLDPHRKTSKTPYTDIPRDALHAYNACDAYYTRRLVDELWAQMDSTLRNLYTSLMMPASRALINMTMRGIRIDRRYATELDAEYANRQREALVLLEEKFGKGFNPNSPKQVQEALGRIGFRVASTKREILEELPGEEVKKILEYRHLTKMRSTYIEGFVELADSDDRVHPGYKQYDTTTGRLAAQNPPIQTVPRETTERNLFVSQPGWTLIACDFGMNEYRCVAYLSQDPFLKDVFTRGVDLHREAVNQYLNGVRIPQGFDARTIAKMINFGLLYGRGAWSLSIQLGVTEREAQDMINRYFARMPQVKAFMDAQKKSALTTGIIETPFGRRRRFGLVTRDNREEVVKQAYNFPVQSTGSDLCLHALIELDQMLDPKWAFPVTILHDAIVVECRDDRVDEVRKLIEDTMLFAPFKQLTDLDFSWEVESGIGQRWGETKKTGRKVLSSPDGTSSSIKA